eukprot:2815430-Pleurochrysis_carterae.AAC.1
MVSACTLWSLAAPCSTFDDVSPATPATECATQNTTPPSPKATHPRDDPCVEATSDSKTST